MCQQNSSTPRGAVRTQRLSCGTAPSAPASARSAVPIIAAPPSASSKRGDGARGNDPQLERRSRRPRADQQRLVIDGDEPLAAAHLLGRDVAEQVRAHRPLVVGGRPLALASDLRRHEVERVQLRVRVLERRPGLGPLVDDQVQVGGPGVCAHPLAPGGDRRLQALRRQLRERGRVLGGADDHLVDPGRRLGAEQVRLAAGRRPERVDRARDAGLHRRPPRADLAAGLGLGQHRVEVGDRAGAPPRRVGRHRRVDRPRPRAACGLRAPRRTGSPRRRRASAPPAGGRRRRGARRGLGRGSPAGR